MEEKKNPIQVAERLFSILELLAEHKALSVSELTALTKLNKSTVHRLLTSLCMLGYVSQNEQNGKYELSFKILELSNSILDRIDIAKQIHPYLEKLMELTGETVHLVRLEKESAVYIDKIESDLNSIRMVSKIGRQIPLYCSGVGKAILASMDNASIQKIWSRSDIKQLTPYTITHFDDLLTTISQIRENGYALDMEENEIGVRCIAVSLMDKKSRTRYAFSISAPLYRMTEARIDELLAYALQTKDAILYDNSYLS